MGTTSTLTLEGGNPMSSTFSTRPAPAAAPQVHQAPSQALDLQEAMKYFWDG